MDYIKGGRGRQAPYTSTHVRIPEPIKELVLVLAGYYRNTLIVPNLNASIAPLKDVNSNDDLARENEVKNLETINNMADRILSQDNEIAHLKYKLHIREQQPSLGYALMISTELLKSKKSAKQTVKKLLTDLYHADIEDEHLS